MQQPFWDALPCILYTTTVHLFFLCQTLLFIAGSGPELRNALSSVAEVIVNPDWKIKDGENEINGIEHAGLHMILKKLAQHDSVALQTSKATFGECLCSKVADDTVIICYFLL